MKIGELANTAQVSVEAVRFYEKRGLLPKALRNASGYRTYAAEDVKRLRFICYAKNLGFTLEEIKQLLALRTNTPDCQSVRRFSRIKADEIKTRITQLRSMHEVLIRLIDECEQGGTGDPCPILAALEDNDPG